MHLDEHMVGMDLVRQLCYEPRKNNTVLYTTVILGTEIRTITPLKQIRIRLYCHSIQSCVNWAFITEDQMS